MLAQWRAKRTQELSDETEIGGKKWKDWKKLLRKKVIIYILKDMIIRLSISYGNDRFVLLI